MRVKYAQPTSFQAEEGFTNYNSSYNTASQGFKTNNFLQTQNQFQHQPQEIMTNTTPNFYSNQNSSQRKPIKSDEFFENLKNKLENPQTYLFNSKENKEENTNFNNYLTRERENLKQTNIEFEINRKRDKSINSLRSKEEKRKVDNDSKPNLKESIKIEELKKNQTNYLDNVNFTSLKSQEPVLKNVNMISNTLSNLGDEYNLSTSNHYNNTIKETNSKSKTVNEETIGKSSNKQDKTKQLLSMDSIEDLVFEDKKKTQPQKNKEDIRSNNLNEEVNDSF